MVPYLLASSNARKARAAQFLALAGSLLIAPFFFVGGPEWTDGPLYKSAWNFGHILFFALLTIAVKPWRMCSGWWLWGLCTLAVLLLGLAIELLQYGFSRQVEVHDLFRNLLGLWSILAIRPLASLGVCSRLASWWLRGLVSMLLVFEAGITAGIAVQQFEVSRLLPALYDFSQPDPSTFWQGATLPEAAQNRPQGLEIALSTRGYSGATLHNFPGDWRGYDQLVLALYNPHDHALEMSLRVNDVQHDLGNSAHSDRFNTGLYLSPGFNLIRIELDGVRNAPRGRDMDMDKVRRLILFTHGLEEPKTIYLRDIRLE